MYPCTKGHRDSHKKGKRYCVYIYISIDCGIDLRLTGVKCWLELFYCFVSVAIFYFLFFSIFKLLAKLKLIELFIIYLIYIVK